jgi:polar amino acid transport system substrate-binding protein
MKKLFALVLAILMVTSLLAGCQAADSNDLKATYTVTGKYKNHNLTTVTPGKLIVAISPDFAPMEFVDPTKAGQDMYVGFDVTLSKYLADELGLDGGYRVVTNAGPDAGQTVLHLHFHLLGGKLGPMA